MKPDLLSDTAAMRIMHTALRRDYARARAGTHPALKDGACVPPPVNPRPRADTAHH